MMNRIPDTLAADTSGKFTVSIRLRSGGLSFSGYIPSAAGSFFYQEAEFDRSVSYITSLKDFFYANEFFEWTYNRIHIVPLSSQYTIVPQALFDDKRKEEMFAFNFSRPENACLFNTLDDEQAVIVFGIDKEVHEFCSRSFINPLFVHPVTPQLALCKRQSRISPARRMYGIRHDKALDIICYDQGNLTLVNTFQAETLDDILYYLLFVWRQAGMDQEKDELYLFDNTGKYNALTHILHTYLRQIRPVEIPTEAYLLGTDMARMPADIISLAVCEL
ncbi:hypothetical protein Barb6_02141 [Bacteroidales bacterium Barb6]|nr:hypothetical protein Barb6_02141 [Bacteroidales bacterium Barb6]